jgi:hypothetical protein
MRLTAMKSDRELMELAKTKTLEAIAERSIRSLRDRSRYLKRQSDQPNTEGEEMTKPVRVRPAPQAGVTVCREALRQQRRPWTVGSPSNSREAGRRLY